MIFMNNTKKVKIIKLFKKNRVVCIPDNAARKVIAGWPPPPPLTREKVKQATRARNKQTNTHLSWPAQSELSRSSLAGATWAERNLAAC
jgi:hypothetical protein